MAWDKLHDSQFGAEAGTVEQVKLVRQYADFQPGVADRPHRGERLRARRGVDRIFQRRAHQHPRIGPLLADQAADFGGAQTPIFALGDAVGEHVAPQLVIVGIERTAPAQGAGCETELALDLRLAFEGGSADHTTIVQHKG